MQRPTSFDSASSSTGSRPSSAAAAVGAWRACIHLQAAQPSFSAGRSNDPHPTTLTKVQFELQVQIAAKHKAIKSPQSRNETSTMDSRDRQSKQCRRHAPGLVGQVETLGKVGAGNGGDERILHV